MTQVIQTFLILTSPSIQKAYDIAKAFQYLQNVFYFIQQTPNNEMELHYVAHNWNVLYRAIKTCPVAGHGLFTSLFTLHTPVV